jgi:hypothetical protein
MLLRETHRRIDEFISLPSFLGSRLKSKNMAGITNLYLIYDLATVTSEAVKPKI